MKAIILARVSSKEQEEGQSIPAQVHRAEQYIRRKGLDLIHTFQITESSTKQKRKQFDEIDDLAEELDEALCHLQEWEAKIRGEEN